MVLTEQQKRWNELVEQSLKNKNIKEIYNKVNPTIIELYDELKNKILQFNQERVAVVEKSNYISFKINKNNKSFVDIQIQESAIKCVINLKKRSILNKQKFLRDISKLGHFGSGDYESTIKSSQDISSCMPFILESYKINS